MILSYQFNDLLEYEAKDSNATLRGLKKEYQHSCILTVELDKVLFIIGSQVEVAWWTRKEWKGYSLTITVTFQRRYDLTSKTTSIFDESYQILICLFTPSSQFSVFTPIDFLHLSHQLGIET